MESTTAESPEPRSAGRSISPRRALPSGRALVGAFLVTVATLGAFVVATGGDDGPTTSFLVTTRDLTAGEAITEADVRFEAMTLSDDLAGRALNSTAGIDGAVVLRDFRAGELIDVADVIAGVDGGGAIDGDLHEITIGVPLERTPSSLVVGDRVTILATADDTTRVAVEDARVLEVDRRPDQIGSSGRGILTLAIDDPAVVLEVAHLTQTADITVVRSTRALDDVFPTETSTEDAS
ncbi:MAG: SAF domain-containing protein [Actinomycetota bacterium]